MTLGANQIAAYAADLLDTEEQIEALQGSKRDLYASIRDEHGKADALSLKRAVKLSRMEPEKRDEAEAIDTEAQRMLNIIERAARAPRATHVATNVPTPADEADDQSTADGKDRPFEAMHDASPKSPAGEGKTSAEAAAKLGAGTQAPPVDTKSQAGDEAGRPEPLTEPSTSLAGAEGDEDRPPNSPPTAADNARKIRPYCLHADDLNKCGGMGRVHCHACLKAHADAEGVSA